MPLDLHRRRCAAARCALLGLLAALAGCDDDPAGGDRCLPGGFTIVIQPSSVTAGARTLTVTGVATFSAAGPPARTLEGPATLDVVDGSPLLPRA